MFDKKEFKKKKVKYAYKIYNTSLSRMEIPLFILMGMSNRFHWEFRYLYVYLERRSNHVQSKGSRVLM